MKSTFQSIGWGMLSATLGLCIGCANDGHLELFGYTTMPPYDCAIQTVYVPIFENVSFRRGLEFDLTRAVVREIEAKTPYRVVNRREQADTELIGRIINRRKSLINTNEVGEVRESEVLMAVEMQWRDLRPGHPGEFLSKGDNVRKSDGAGNQEPPPTYPGAFRRSRDQGTVIVQPVATFVPELGGSVTSAEKLLVDRLAVQIVSMMEQPW